MSECPVCNKLHLCVRCGKEVPDWMDQEKIYLPMKHFVVEFENGSQHHVVAGDKPEALRIARISSARTAFLCLDCLVKVVSVTEVGAFEQCID